MLPVYEVGILIPPNIEQIDPLPDLTNGMQVELTIADESRASQIKSICTPYTMMPDKPITMPIHSRINVIIMNTICTNKQTWVYMCVCVCVCVVGLGLLLWKLYSLISRDSNENNEVWDIVRCNPIKAHKKFIRQKVLNAPRCY